MFKKLKDKITEEVKSSPQRIQQFTQSVTERIQSSSNDDNLFTIADEDNATNANMEPGFSNVSLTPSNSDRPRRTSVSSLSSDISYLPRYESSMNAYHLQSDLDVSASEIEDNLSSASSPIGNVSKEQMYSAFQKSQMRYHKYRGRYTDLANHYKELERENAKMKSVLVDTQDKAIRRMTELKEQCALEQKAKAHLESALRLELDEKEYVINTLKTKIDLLQNGTKTENLIELNNKKEEEQENLELLTKYLNEARVEIESLNGKMQEHKANKIILESKSSEYKQKIGELEKALQEKNKEIVNLASREKENNIMIAETKMQLNGEIRAKDAEIANLKTECEKLKQDVVAFDKKERTSKLENLQTQNAKLIEKIESLNQKCKNNESELLKLEQYKIEITNLNESIKTVKQDKERLSEEIESIVTNTRSKDEFLKLENDYKELEMKYRDAFAQSETFKAELQTLTSKLTEYDEILAENNRLKQKIADSETETGEIRRSNQNLQQQIDESSKKLQDLTGVNENLEESVRNLQKSLQESVESVEKDRAEMKSKLIQLESKIRAKLTIDFDKEKEVLKAEFQAKLEELTSDNVTMSELQMKLMDNEKELERMKKNACNVEKELNDSKAKYAEIADGHLELINENNANMQKVKLLKKTVESLEKEAESRKTNEKMLKDEMQFLQQVSADQQNKICELTKELETVANEKAEIADRERSLRIDLDNARSELDDNRKQTDELQQKIELMESARDDLLKLQENHDKLTKQLKDENEGLQREVASLNRKLTALEEKCVESQTALTNIIRERDNLQETLNAKEDAEILLADARNRLEESESENVRLDAELTRLRETSIPKAELDVANELNDRLRGELQTSENRNDEQQQLAIAFKDDLANLQAENDRLVVEQKKRLHEIDVLNGRIIEMNEWEVKYKNLVDENSNLKEELKAIQTQMESLNAENSKSSTTNEALLLDAKRYTREIAEINERLNRMIAEKTASERNLLELREKYEALSEELTKRHEEALKTNEAKHVAEIAELAARNRLLEADFKATADENERLVVDYEETKLKLRNVDEELARLRETNAKLADENERLATSRVSLENGDKWLAEKSELEKQLNELEAHFSEIDHERQLLRDEIQELKTAPINLTNEDNNNDTEIERLNEKIQRYKSLDLTNRTSIEFYESELQKMKNKNEKLTRKLDETLVTLNHCAELSNSTEVEYLKNVLYNYMLGKEGLVLARVIAAVCKFDPEQTETIMQREQQKQTLLGQLGIL